MVEEHVDNTTSEKGIGALIACFVAFGAYFINVLVGKANISYGLNLPHLGNVPEFLLLSMASVLLIIAALKAEAAEQ